MRVFVTGATGLIGTRLVRQLLGRGEEVVVLTRRPAEALARFGTACRIVEGDPVRTGSWMDAIDECDGVIHLAGENVFGRRWSEEFKKLLFDSRVDTTRHVVEALLQARRRGGGRPRVLVNASAIGYYGPHGDEELTEDSPPGTDFLAQLCVAWEQAARLVEGEGLRCAVVRVGVVLDPDGGALAKLLTPFKLFAGGRAGSGRQWMSWIHRDDMVRLFLFALDNANATGPLNGSSPNPVTNRDFSRELGHALHRPSFLPTPRFALRALLGEVAGLVTTGQRVLPHRPLALGFHFEYPTLDTALRQLVS